MLERYYVENMRMWSEPQANDNVEVVTYTDAQATIAAIKADALDVSNKQQATIADLQGQLAAIETAFDIDSGKSTLDKAKDLQRSFKQTWASYQDAVNELFKAQQRVAQLEGELAGWKNVASIRNVAKLRADHARVLGLVQALPVVQDSVLANYMKDMARYDEQDYLAFAALLHYRAILPAQPAQSQGETRA